MATTSAAPIDENGIVTIGNRRMVLHEQAAFLLGLKPPSFSSAISRGRIPLTRYPRGRGFMYDLAEIEQLIVKRAVKAGQRVR